MGEKRKKIQFRTPQNKERKEKKSKRTLTRPSSSARNVNELGRVTEHKKHWNAKRPRGRSADGRKQVRLMSGKVVKSSLTKKNIRPVWRRRSFEPEQCVNVASHNTQVADVAPPSHLLWERKAFFFPCRIRKRVKCFWLQVKIRREEGEKR